VPAQCGLAGLPSVAAWPAGRESGGGAWSGGPISGSRWLGFNPLVVPGTRAEPPNGALDPVHLFQPALPAHNLSEEALVMGATRRIDITYGAQGMAGADSGPSIALKSLCDAAVAAPVGAGLDSARLRGTGAIGSVLPASPYRAICHQPARRNRRRCRSAAGRRWYRRGEVELPARASRWPATATDRPASAKLPERKGIPGVGRVDRVRQAEGRVGKSTVGREPWAWLPLARQRLRVGTFWM